MNTSRHMHTRRSVHELNNVDKFSFDAEKYSAFKHGSVTATKDIALELAVLFANSIAPCISKDIVVTGGAYTHIPSASSLLKDEFVRHINEIHYHIGRSPVSEIKMHRNSVYSSDYGKLDVAGRADLICDDVFYIDKDYIKGKHLVAIDDICVTGIHESMVTKCISNICDTTYLYYIDTCREVANLNPEVESTINTALIKDVQDLTDLIESSYGMVGGYRLTARAVKLILGAHELEFTLAIERLLEIGIAEELFYAAIGNNYHSVDEYKDNIEYLRTRL